MDYFITPIGKYKGIKQETFTHTNLQWRIFQVPFSNLCVWFRAYQRLNKDVFVDKRQNPVKTLMSAPKLKASVKSLRIPMRLNSGKPRNGILDSSKDFMFYGLEWFLFIALSLWCRNWSSPEWKCAWNRLCTQYSWNLLHHSWWFAYRKLPMNNCFVPHICIWAKFEIRF